VINCSARFYYNLSSLITRKQFDQEPFNATLWRRRIRRVGKAVPAGNIQRVVGMNHDNYVLNSSSDTFLFDHQRDCVSCPTVFKDAFRRFANAVEPHQNSSYSFVHIDISSNNVADGFINQGARTITIYFAPYNTPFVFPLEKYASVKHPIPFELPDNETVTQI
jgi:hypothetical protein